MFDNPNKTYIKSNTATIMHLMWFVCGLLLVLVAGLCTFVIFGRDDKDNYHFDSAHQFYYEIKNDQVNVVKFIDHDAETLVIPTTVNYGGKDYDVTKIDAEAFSNHSKLTTLEIPDSVTEIAGDEVHQTGAFSGCVKLKEVKLGQGLTHIGAYAFKNCLALQNIVFPVNMQFIAEGAFQGCVALQSVTFNDNVVLDANSFKNCVNIQSLTISDDFRFDKDVKRQAFAPLTNLKTIAIKGDKPIYHIVNNCLFQTVSSADDTLVLGCCNVNEIPDSTKQILDWAFAGRANQMIYVPSTVEKIGANSFGLVSICKDGAEDKPDGWLTDKVYTKAQKVTCDPDLSDVESVSYYIYFNGQRMVEPVYADIFPDAKPTMPFDDWEIADDVYKAKYKSPHLASDRTALETEIGKAQKYFVDHIAAEDEATRLLFTLDFWNEFTQLYYQALALMDRATAYQYAVDDITAKLEEANQKITDHDASVLESTDWTVGLQNLVNAIEKLNILDLAASTQFDEIEQQKAESEYLLKGGNVISVENARNTWLKLRQSYEKIQVNCGADSPLQKEIETCQQLNRADYTKASWGDLQTKLNVAETIVQDNLIHYLMITKVREELIAARESLREVTVPNDKITLDTWVSVCLDLPESDYQSNAYSRLFGTAISIKAKISRLETKQQVATNLSDLQSRYANLVPANNYAEYQNSTGILNKKSVPFFATAVLLFTGAVAAGAKASMLGKQLRQTQE